MTIDFVQWINEGFEFKNAMKFLRVAAKAFEYKNLNNKDVSQYCIICLKSDRLY